MKSRMMKASEFKAKCLQLMDEVAKTGGRIVITKNGRPVSELVPHRQPCESLFGRHKEQLRVQGDILAPLEDAWEADS